MSNILSHIGALDLIYFKVQVSNDKIELLKSKLYSRQDDILKMLNGKKLSSNTVKRFADKVKSLSIEDLQKMSADDMLKELSKGI